MADAVTTEEFEHPDVILCPGGPMLLRGEHVIKDDHGVEHATTRNVSAVCRCGHTSTTPWCDGTHKVATNHRRVVSPASTGRTAP